MEERSWSPVVIDGLFLDSVDYKGLLFHYERIMNNRTA